MPLYHVLLSIIVYLKLSRFSKQSPDQLINTRPWFKAILAHCGIGALKSRLTTPAATQVAR